ncbi:hypothetical protein [Pelagibaculum spongiae]|uniref:MFS transporter n=1 Tax=Pelagibaculum spongiae TaxID=2080658 RepID=A0A2V1H1Y3_9GAMM|nr:hypothetical protein [Pelagibaculum spongiae]PVZ69690.1 hypothetical protein DC094_10340 [Pelagibaculum spongiae]
MLINIRYFYQFSGLHALLIGLLPFFIPVILWRQQQSLAQVAWFISISGFSFLIALGLWEKLRNSRFNHSMIKLAFFSECLLVGMLVLMPQTSFQILVLAVLNGVYSCCYWLPQRMLFKKLSTSQNSGNEFGNFQILVGILLKIGILTGGYLLENHGGSWLLALSLLISAVGLWMQQSVNNRQQIDQAVGQQTVETVPLSEVIRFKDSQNSRGVFIVDGLFLFLESYFWLLSLFFIGQQSFSRLSLIIVTLTICLSVIFFLIKRQIDKVDAYKLFQAATVLYIASWILRGWVSPDHNNLMLSIAIVAIAFFTSLFRLAFNKLFFDLADKQPTQRYLLAKSWFTQLGVGVFFAAVALLLQLLSNSQLGLPFNYDQLNNNQTVLSWIYWASAPLASIYFLYARQNAYQLAQNYR